MTVLILEDSGFHAESLKEILTALGYSDIVWAQSSTDAYHYLEGGKQFDFGIFDIDLREAVDGIDVGVKFIKKTKLPVIFATQYTDRDSYIARLTKEGIRQHFFISKKQLENKLFLSRCISDALENYESPKPSDFLQLQYVTRRIGLLTGEAKTRNYVFYKKDDIIFIEADGDKTIVHLSNDKKAVVSRNIGSVGSRISNVFYNIVRLDRSFYVNLEQIEHLEGTTLYFSNDAYIPLSTAGMHYLKNSNLLITAKR